MTQEKKQEFIDLCKVYKQKGGWYDYVIHHVKPEWPYQGRIMYQPVLDNGTEVWADTYQSTISIRDRTRILFIIGHPYFFDELSSYALYINDKVEYYDRSELMKRVLTLRGDYTIVHKCRYPFVKRIKKSVISNYQDDFGIDVFAISKEIHKSNEGFYFILRVIDDSQSKPFDKESLGIMLNMDVSKYKAINDKQYWRDLHISELHEIYKLSMAQGVTTHIYDHPGYIEPISLRPNSLSNLFYIDWLLFKCKDITSYKPKSFDEQMAEANEEIGKEPFFLETSITLMDKSIPAPFRFLHLFTKVHYDTDTMYKGAVSILP